mmetsp:Transcript_11071/g.23301  ORF Transcript_11071/g.23301 Transcript_11071/m.23301 type:complete len:132 (-) Transcript_11071:675-1070(-)
MNSNIVGTYSRGMPNVNLNDGLCTINNLIEPFVDEGSCNTTSYSFNDETQYQKFIFTYRTKLSKGEHNFCAKPPWSIPPPISQRICRDSAKNISTVKIGRNNAINASTTTLFSLLLDVEFSTPLFLSFLSG